MVVSDSESESSSSSESNSSSSSSSSGSSRSRTPHHEKETQNSTGKKTVSLKEVLIEEPISKGDNKENSVQIELSNLKERDVVDKIISEQCIQTTETDPHECNVVNEKEGKTAELEQNKNVLANNGENDRNLDSNTKNEQQENAEIDMEQCKPREEESSKSPAPVIKNQNENSKPKDHREMNQKSKKDELSHPKLSEALPKHRRDKSKNRSRSRSRTPLRRKERTRSRERRRSASIERRREERKRRHAEQEERENRKRKKSSFELDNIPFKERPKENAVSMEHDNETVTDPKAKITERQRRTVDLLTSRTGGAYIPPAKLRMMQAEITDKSSAAYQRIAWEALKKSIHGYINKVNVDNIAIITRELLKENIVRGRGLLCRSIIQAQAASPTFTHVYAALVSIINSKFPSIGELLLKRLVIQFKRAFRRNDKNVCLSSSRFVAHLVNQRVAHEILALEILTLLVETPTDDSVEVAIAFLKECGMKLTEVTSKGIGAIFEMLKNILHEGKLEKRVQYMIEVVFQVRKDGFKDHQSVIESLELVEEDDQFTHLLMLDEATNPEEILNAFKFDDKYVTNEDKYKGLSKEILGSDISGESNSGSSSDSESDDSADSEAENGKDKSSAGDIIDNTETNLIALRRTIYLTINSSLDYEECAHKLMKMQLKPGQEIELCHMFLDCCAEQRTYEKFYGLLAQRFCSINKIYIEPFEEIFKDTYQTTHRLDTNRLRNVSKFFAHLLFTDAIGWDVLECIKLNEDDTTSSSRIFIKILFQELAEYMGLGKLNSKLKDDALTSSLTGLFPKDNPRNTRFAINFFTSIGLGGLTDELRQFLKNAPKTVPAINTEILNQPISSSSSSSSSASSSSKSSSSSESSSASTSSSSSSESDASKKKRKQNKKYKQIKRSNKKKSSSVEKNNPKGKPKYRKKKKVSEDDSSSSSSTQSSSSSPSTDLESSEDDKKKRKKKVSDSKSSKQSISRKRSDDQKLKTDRRHNLERDGQNNDKNSKPDRHNIKKDNWHRAEDKFSKREKEMKYDDNINYEHRRGRENIRNRQNHSDDEYYSKRNKESKKNVEKGSRHKQKSTRDASKERG